MMHAGTRLTTLAALAAAALLLPAARSTADASSPVIASADFQSDAVGAAARPYGPPTVAEDLWEDSTTGSGVSRVVSSGGSARSYRIADTGSTDAHRGIRLPLSESVTSGTLELRATVTAEQTGAEGGALANEEPERNKWFVCLAFGGDGKFKVHGEGTDVAYSANTRYLFRITVHLDGTPTADYRVTDLDANEVVLVSTGHAVESGFLFENLTFRTGEADNGAFTIDDIQASH